MGIDKPRTSTVAPLAEKQARLEPALAEPEGPEGLPVVELVLAPVDQASVEAAGRLVLERKISEPVIGLGVGRAPIVRAPEPVRCRRITAVAQIISAIDLSHRVPGSVRVTTLLVAVDLTEVPLDQQAAAGGPAWEAVDLTVLLEERADALLEAHVVAVADVEDDKKTEKET